MIEAKVVPQSIIHHIPVKDARIMPLPPLTGLISCPSLASRRVISPSLIGGAHRTYDRGKGGATKHDTSYPNKGNFHHGASPPFCFIPIITIIRSRDTLITHSTTLGCIAETTGWHRRPDSCGTMRAPTSPKFPHPNLWILKSGYSIHIIGIATSVQGLEIGKMPWKNSTASRNRDFRPPPNGNKDYLRLIYHSWSSLCGELASYCNLLHEPSSLFQEPSRTNIELDKHGSDATDHDALLHDTVGNYTIKQPNYPTSSPV